MNDNTNIIVPKTEIVKPEIVQIEYTKMYPDYLWNAKVISTRQGKGTWYTAEDRGGHKHTAMRTERDCSDCKGSGVLHGFGLRGMTAQEVCDSKCPRCHGDGKLTNRFVFNPAGMLCALPDQLAKHMGATFGCIVRVQYTRQDGSWMGVYTNYVDIGPTNELFIEKNHIVDLTPAAFRVLTNGLALGLINVQVDVLEVDDE